MQQAIETQQSGRRLPAAGADPPAPHQAGVSRGPPAGRGVVDDPAGRGQPARAGGRAAGRTRADHHADHQPDRAGAGHLAGPRYDGPPRGPPPARGDACRARPVSIAAGNYQGPPRGFLAAQDLTWYRITSRDAASRRGRRRPSARPVVRARRPPSPSRPRPRSKAMPGGAGGTGLRLGRRRLARLLPVPRPGPRPARGGLRHQHPQLGVRAEGDPRLPDRRGAAELADLPLRLQPARVGLGRRPAGRLRLRDRRAARGRLRHGVRLGLRRDRPAGSAGGYPRADLTRFASIYTSGRGNYTISYPNNNTALALPLDNGRTSAGEDVSTSIWQSAPLPALSDLAVPAASLSLFRAEEMATLAGAIRLEGGRRGPAGGQRQRPGAARRDAHRHHRPGSRGVEGALPGDDRPGRLGRDRRGGRAKAPETDRCGARPGPEHVPPRGPDDLGAPRRELRGDPAGRLGGADDARPGDRTAAGPPARASPPCWSTSAAARRPSPDAPRYNILALGPEKPHGETTQPWTGANAAGGGRRPRGKARKPRDERSKSRRASRHRAPATRRPRLWRRTTDDRGDQLHQALRRVRRRRRPELHHRQGGDLRLHRAQRRRQEHDHPLPGHAAAADLGRGPGRGLLGHVRRRWPSAGSSASCPTISASTTA